MGRRHAWQRRRLRHDSCWRNDSLLQVSTCAFVLFSLPATACKLAIVHLLSFRTSRRPRAILIARRRLLHVVAFARAVSCRSCTPGAASFVKVELVNTGTDMLSAMNDKYNDTTVHGGGAIAGTSGKAVPVLLVGDEKIRYVPPAGVALLRRGGCILKALQVLLLYVRFKTCSRARFAPRCAHLHLLRPRRAQQALGKLWNVSLREAPVSSITPGSLSCCPKIRELDLRSTLLWQWDAVAELGRQVRISLARPRHVFGVTCPTRTISREPCAASSPRFLFPPRCINGTTRNCSCQRCAS